MEEGITPNMHRAEMPEPLEKRLERSHGDVEETFDGLMTELEQNPNNEEAQRQAKLLVNRLEDFLKQKGENGKQTTH